MKINNFIIFFMIFTTSIFAETLKDYQNLLKKVDNLVTFEDTDLSAEYTIVKRDPDGATSTNAAAMFRRDRTDQFLILILEPVVDKGKGYLKIGDNLWLYDPVGRSFTFTSARERFQNSSARNSDFRRSNYYKDYQVISGKKTSLGKFDCFLLELDAVSEDVSFQKIKIWISEDNLVRKIEDYSLSGQKMRTTAIPTYQKVGERWVPKKIVILDHLIYMEVSGKNVYERTTISIDNPSLKELPDTVYTKEYLEKVNS